MYCTDIIARLRACQRGAIAVTTAIVFPILLGFSAIGVEVGHWYLVQRQMQGAADAAALSATAQYVQDYNAGNPTSQTFKTVGVHYASLNNFTIPLSYVCLIDPNGVDGCGSVEAIDARPVVCHQPPCVVVEVAQDTAGWLSTQASLEPNGLGKVEGVPRPVLLARAVVSAKSQLVTAAGGDCVLALANDPQAIFIHGNGDPQSKCGFAIDGGRDQNAGTPVRGGITFSGANAKVNIGLPGKIALTVAAPTANCPDNGVHCQQFGSTAAMLPSAVKMGTGTPDPFAPQIAALFQTAPPLGANSISVAAGGAGYTGTTCTFSITGGTFYEAASTPTKFTATVTKGKITAAALIDPGAYATFPSGTLSATSSNCGSGSGAKFTLTEGCYTWKGTAIAGRKYCSINLNGAGTTNFPAGNYWIAGGDTNCVGFCVSSNNATVTSDSAGVTFFFTNGEGTGTFGTSSYATVAITSGNVSLCAPGTGCGTGCTNAAGPASCMLFIQNPAATVSTALNTPANTVNNFAGNGTRTLSGLIYLPKQTFAESGNGPISGCLGVVAKYFDIGGTPTFSDGCLPGDGIGSTVTTSLSNPHLSQ